MTRFPSEGSNVDNRACNMNSQHRLLVAVISCFLALLLSRCPSSSGSDEEKSVRPAVQHDEDDEKATEQRELKQIQALRQEYQNLSGQVASRLRRFQGIAGLLSFHGERQSLDTRLTGKGPRISGLTDEFETPKRISYAEEVWIRLAGDIRAEECANLLLNRIADDREKVPVNARSMVPSDFTLAALCQIGPPACREALKRIPLESDKRRREKMVRLLQVVLGNSRARSGLMRLQETVGDDVQIERIAFAISQIAADDSREAYPR